MNRVGGFDLPTADRYFAPILAQGAWEPDKLDAALAHVTDWRVAVDGGAHVGLYTRTLAQRFASVHAFEPAADTYGCLKRNTAALDGVICWRVALGDQFRHVEVRDDAARPGNTGARYIEATGKIAAGKMRPLDHFALTSVGFIKLDLEGAELLALRGAVETIRRCKPVVMIEVKKGMAARFGHADEAAPTFLLAMGAREVKRIRADRIFIFDE